MNKNRLQLAKVLTSDQTKSSFLTPEPTFNSGDKVSLNMNHASLIQSTQHNLSELESLIGQVQFMNKEIHSVIKK